MISICLYIVACLKIVFLNYVLIDLMFCALVASLFPFHSPVLEPSLHLNCSQVQIASQLRPLSGCQIMLALETLFQTGNL